MRSFLATLTVLVWATTALAHQLNVFAFVEDGIVVVETKFSTGKVTVSGNVRVLDADAAVLHTLPLESDGTVRFPLDPDAAAKGITIEVITSEGHEDYWILTPEDIARGSGS
jgi:nickel transport protein